MKNNTYSFMNYKPPEKKKRILTNSEKLNKKKYELAKECMNYCAGETDTIKFHKKKIVIEFK